MRLQNLVYHRSENTFAKFGAMVIFHLSFFIFISTIGLNIIFGIIVDTFSELRDLKVCTSYVCWLQVRLIKRSAWPRDNYLGMQP